MAVKKICVYPDPLLRKQAEDVKNFDDKLNKLVGDMWDTMYAADGIGLAGPQIGAALKVIVIDYEGDKYALINPEIKGETGQAVHEEGCLSFPGIYEKVISPEKMKVRWQDVKGDFHEEIKEGFLACIFSHEIDHLSGRLLIDRISPIKRSFLKKKLAKERKS